MLSLIYIQGNKKENKTEHRGIFKKNPNKTRRIQLTPCTTKAVLFHIAFWRNSTSISFSNIWHGKKLNHNKDKKKCVIPGFFSLSISRMKNSHDHDATGFSNEHEISRCFPNTSVAVFCARDHVNCPDLSCWWLGMCLSPCRWLNMAKAHAFS